MFLGIKASLPSCQTSLH